ncbi:MAG: type IX secretion system protein PorQ [Salinivirgaceae bacterium]|jgi:hypothetical protein|nr:type IX secretion system protein PorQ [Salinivirgaceae bacterium]
MRYGIIIFALLISTGLLRAQSDYSSVYRFLTLPTSAYSASLGGSPIASADSNINLISVNPALLNEKTHSQMGLNFSNVSPGINMGMIAYGFDWAEKGSFGFGFQYLNYGQMDAYDEFGADMGTFSGGDYALMASWSQLLLKDLRIGATVKGIYSKIDRYQSLAAAFDAGLTYNNEEWLLTVSVVAKNIGSQIDEYIEGENEPLPQDYQFGIAKGLPHAPFRFSVVAHHLHQTNLLIENQNTVTPNNTDLAPDELEIDYINNQSEKIARHLIFGVEFLPSEKFTARVGYNYYRRSTMKMIEKGGMVGFSLGASLLIKGIHVEYAYTANHLAGGINQLSIRTNPSRFF